MKNTTDIFACFVAALNDSLKKGVHGDKKKLAQAVGVTTGYISHLLAGRRQGPEHIRRAIAAALGYKYEQFLGRGHAVLLGHDPDEHGYAYIYIGENTFVQRPQLFGIRDKSRPRTSVVKPPRNLPAAAPVYRPELAQTVRLVFEDPPLLPQSLLDKLSKLDDEGRQRLDAWLDGYLAHKP